MVWSGESVAIISAEPLPLLISARLADDFSDSDLPWRVDILDWATTSASFKKIVERGKVVLQGVVPTSEQMPQGRAQPEQDALAADGAVHRDAPDFDTGNKAT